MSIPMAMTEEVAQGQGSAPQGKCATAEPGLYVTCNMAAGSTGTVTGARTGRGGGGVNLTNFGPNVPAPFARMYVHT